MTEECGIEARKRGSVAGVLCLVLVFAAIQGQVFAAETKGMGLPPQGSIRILGKIPIPKDSELDSGRVVLIDSARRRAFYTFARGARDGIAQYDLDSNLPRLLREGDLGPYDPNRKTSPYAWTLDARRNRLLSFSYANDLHSLIDVIDARTLKVTDHWDTNSSNRLPGFYPFGITYAAQEDRIYLLGSMVYTDYVQNLAGAFSPTEPSMVVALDGTTGALLWARPVPECQVPIYEDFKGSRIVRSEFRDALYFACTPGAPVQAGVSYPGHSGVVRLSIDPQATGAEALGFRADFFAISGFYPNGDYGGAVAFDPKTDRLFLQSISGLTPGAWVFDGRLESWVGFIASPGSIVGKPEFFGVNTRTGQYYMGGSGAPGFLLVTNDRPLPIPQGSVFTGLQTEGFIAVDEGSHRLFMRDGKHEWLVLEDRTPEFLAPQGADFDALTQDIEESAQTEVNFVSGITGYGARATLVGGYSGMISTVANPDFVSVGGVTLGLVRPTDRAVTLAAVPSVDLRGGTSSASAQAGALDPDSSSDLGSTRNTLASQPISPLVATQLRQALASNENLAPPLQEALDAAADVIEENGTKVETSSPIPEARATAASNLEWPWPSLACLDGEGKKDHQEPPEELGGSASITCDISGLTSEASARWGQFVEGPLTIASASFESKGWRDPKTGANTLITATTDGIKIALEGVGTIKIGHIESTVSTVAHGRPGTAKATWSSTIEQVRVLDAAGNPLPVPQACDDRESCKELAADITHALAGRIRVFVPDAHVEGTDRGAFATVEKRFEDFLNDSTVNDDQSKAVPALQIEIYKDNVERSRLVLQFAAIQANSIYTISPALDSLGPEIPPIPPPGEILPGIINTGPPVVGGPQGFIGPQQSTGGGGVVRTIVALLIRSPLEALHAAGVWILLAGAVLAVVRRRSFSARINGGGS